MAVEAVVAGMDHATDDGVVTATVVLHDEIMTERALDRYVSDIRGISSRVLSSEMAQPSHAMFDYGDAVLFWLLGSTLASFPIMELQFCPALALAIAY